MVAQAPEGSCDSREFRHIPPAATRCGDEHCAGLTLHAILLCVCVCVCVCDCVCCVLCVCLCLCVVCVCVCV